MKKNFVPDSYLKIGSVFVSLTFVYFKEMCNKNMGFIDLKFVLLTELICKHTLLNWHYLHFNLISQGTKAVTYNERPKMKRDTRQKSSPEKKLLFCRVSLFTFGRSSYVTALICSNITPFVIGQMFIVISKRNLLYLLHLPSGPKTVFMCILTPFKQVRLIKKMKN